MNRRPGKRNHAITNAPIEATNMIAMIAVTVTTTELIKYPAKFAWVHASRWFSKLHDRGRPNGF